MEDFNNPIIQILEKEDLPHIIRTFTFPWSSFQASQEKWDRCFKEQQTNQRTICVAKLGEEYVGYGSLLYNTDYPEFKKLGIPEINDVWIAEGYRGKGVGRKLIQHLESIASKKNYNQIGIGVGLYKDYGMAQKLYIQMGYILDGKGVTYKYEPVVPGNSYLVDDDLIIWLQKNL